MEIFLLLLLFSLYVPLCNCVNNINCSSQTPCSCTFKEGGGIFLEDFQSEQGNKYVETSTASGLNVYRFYPCGVDKPWTPDGMCTTADTACQHSVQGEDKYYSLGQTNMFEIEEAISDGDKSYVKFLYSGGTDANGNLRKCSIKTVCSTNEELKFLIEIEPVEYFLEFRSPKACLVSGGGGAPVLFIFVILVLLLAAVTYSVVGVMLMVFWKGARGFEIIPNLGFWKDFPFLFKDGFLFVFSCIPAARSRIGGQQAYSSLK